MSDTPRDASIRDKKVAQYQGKQNVIELSRRLAVSGIEHDENFSAIGRALTLEVNAMRGPVDQPTAQIGSGDVSLEKARILASALRGQLAQLNLGIVSANPELLGRVMR